tara:strand:+ start:468 stop:1127 length:660 start_codon:yes stop_codon:yes gene_type:complete
MKTADSLNILVIRLYSLSWVYSELGWLFIVHSLHLFIQEQDPMTASESRFSSFSLPNSLLPPSPRSVLHKVPGLLAKPFTSAPFFAQSFILKKVITPIFSQLMLNTDPEVFKGRWIKLAISDINLECIMTANQKLELEFKKVGRTDVTIRGNLKSFILLASQKEDPDTLFFQRDLVIEGDTDLGLHLKNLLDAFDWEGLTPEYLFAVRTAAEYMQLFSE